MNLLEEMNREANSNGIDVLEVVREGLIEMRGHALDVGGMDAAVRLTHAIWWLSRFAETLADSS